MSPSFPKSPRSAAESGMEERYGKTAYAVQPGDLVFLNTYERGDALPKEWNLGTGHLRKVPPLMGKLLHIPVDRVVFNPDQPRKVGREIGDASKVRKARPQQIPILTVPIDLVRGGKRGLYFLCIGGEKRTRQAMARNEKTVYGVADFDPSLKDLSNVAALANIDVTPMNPMDEAEAFRQRALSLVRGGLAKSTDQAVPLVADECRSEKITVNHVRQRLALLRLDPRIQQLIREERLLVSHALLMTRKIFSTPASRESLGDAIEALAQRQDQEECGKRRGSKSAKTQKKPLDSRAVHIAVQDLERSILSGIAKTNRNGGGNGHSKAPARDDGYVDRMLEALYSVSELAERGTGFLEQGRTFNDTLADVLLEDIVAVRRALGNFLTAVEQGEPTKGREFAGVIDGVRRMHTALSKAAVQKAASRAAGALSRFQGKLTEAPGIGAGTSRTSEIRGN